MQILNNTFHVDFTGVSTTSTAANTADLIFMTSLFLKELRRGNPVGVLDHRAVLRVIYREDLIRARMDLERHKRRCP